MKAFIHLLAILFTGQLCFGQGSSSKKQKTNLIAESHPHVYLLAILSRNQLLSTRGRTVELDTLVMNDSTKRISGVFEKIETTTTQGGYVVHYKYAAAVKNTQVELTAAEKEKSSRINWRAEKIEGPYDGEIRLAYGEKLYHIKRIIVKKIPNK